MEYRPPDVSLKCGMHTNGKTLESNFPMMQRLNISKDAFRVDRTFKPKGSVRRMQLVIEAPLIKMLIEEDEGEAFSLKALGSGNCSWSEFSTTVKSKAETVLEKKSPEETFWEQDPNEDIELPNLKFAEIRDDEKELHDIYEEDMEDIYEEETNSIPSNNSSMSTESQSQNDDLDEGETTISLDCVVNEQEAKSVSLEDEVVVIRSFRPKVVECHSDKAVSSNEDEAVITTPYLKEVECEDEADITTPYPKEVECKDEAVIMTPYPKEVEAVIIFPNRKAVEYSDKSETKRMIKQRNGRNKGKTYFNAAPTLIPLKVIPILPSPGSVIHPRNKQRLRKFDPASVFKPREFFKCVKTDSGTDNLVRNASGYFGHNAFVKVHSTMPIKPRP